MEVHGEDINKDEFVAANVGSVAVLYFKLGCLYSYLLQNDLLEEYNDILIKEILQIEPHMINRTQNKYQVRAILFKQWTNRVPLL